MRPYFSDCLILTTGNSATSTPANPDFPNLNGQVTPKSESGSIPAKKTGQAKQRLQKQLHPKKSSSQKQNGISKGMDAELSTVSSVTKAQASSKLQDSSQPAVTAAVVRELKEAGKLKQQSPKLQSSRKATFRKQRAPPKAMDTDLPAALSLSKTQAKATPKPEDRDQLVGNTTGAEKIKQQVAEQPFKKAAFQKQNGTPKRPKIPTVSSCSSSQPPPAKRRKSQSRGGRQPPLTSVDS